MNAPPAGILIVMALAMLVLNWFAFRSDAADAGHGRKQMLQMAAIWATIITAVTLAFGLVNA